MLLLKISAAIYFALAGSVLSQEKPVPEPPELIARRTEYVSSTQRTIAPLLNTYVRNLETLKTQYVRQANLEAALAVDNELKIATQQLKTATSIANGNVPSMQLKVHSVKFGDEKSRRLIDTTKVVQKAQASGLQSMKLSGGVLAPGQDPAPHVVKTVIINYFIDGQQKEKVFKDGDTINFKSDLQ